MGAISADACNKHHTRTQVPLSTVNISCQHAVRRKHLQQTVSFYLLLPLCTCPIELLFSCWCSLLLLLLALLLLLLTSCSGCLSAQHPSACMVAHQHTQQRREAGRLCIPEALTAAVRAQGGTRETAGKCVSISSVCSCCKLTLLDGWHLTVAIRSCAPRVDTHVCRTHAPASAPVFFAMLLPQVPARASGTDRCRAVAARHAQAAARFSSRAGTSRGR